MFHGFFPTITCRNLRAASAAAALLLAGCASGTPGSDAPETSRIRAVVEPTMLAAAATAEAKYDYESAASTYMSLLQRHPGDVNLAVRLARALRYAGKVDQAINVLTPMTAGQDKPAVPVLVELGKAHLAADHLNLAQRYLAEAKRQAPNDWEVLSALAVSYDYQGKFADAQALYLEALSVSPNNSTVLNNLSLSQALSGDLAGAIETQRKAVDQPSGSAQMRQNLALLLAMSGQTEEAERYARMDLPRELLRENLSYYRTIGKTH